MFILLRVEAFEIFEVVTVVVVDSIFDSFVGYLI